MKRILCLIVILVIMLTITGCIPGDGRASLEKPAGFLMGIWHGWIAPFSLIVGIFNHKIRVYEVYNRGWWYDLGFYIALLGGFGGLSIVRRKRDERVIVKNGEKGVVIERID